MTHRIIYTAILSIQVIIANAEWTSVDDNKAEKHIILAEQYSESNANLARIHLDSSLILLTNSSNNELINHAQLIQCMIFAKQRQYEKSYSIANKIYAYYEKEGKVLALAKIHTIIAEYLNDNALLSEALDEYWQSSLYFEAAGDVESFVLTRNSIGNCLYKLNRKEEAKTYFKFVQIYAETHKDSLMLFMSFKNLANAHDKQPEKAIELYKTSITLGKKIEQYDQLTSLYLNMAKAYESLKMHDSAIYYLQIPLNANQLIRRKDKQQILLNLAILYSKEQKTDSSLFYINLLKKYAATAENIEIQEDIYKLNSDIYSQQNNYKDAFFELLEAYKINDSINKSKYNIGLDEIKEKYYYKQKARQTEIHRLEKENQVKQQRIKTLTFGALSGFLGLLIVMGLLNAHKQRKLNFSLNEKNETINKNNIELKNTINTRDRLTSVIAHDIKNPLGSISGFAELLLMNKEKPEKVKQYANIIFKSATNLHALLENLLDWAKSQTLQIKLNPSSININKLVNNTINVLDGAASENNIRLINNCHSDHCIFADGNTVQTIIRNITSNAIKFSNPDSVVEINSKQENDWVIIEITDSGIGIKKDDIQKLFKQDVDRDKIGMHKNKGTGIGLLLCKEFIELNKGFIEVNSEIGKGTVFTLHFPISKN